MNEEIKLFSAKDLTQLENQVNSFIQIKKSQSKFFEILNVNLFVLGGIFFVILHYKFIT
jgi:hypothetical protein